MNCIFVVEDEFDIQELLGNYLAEASYQVLAASDGVEAINLFEKEKDRIDLVLLDVMLPKIDGFGVLEVMKFAKDENEYEELFEEEDGTSEH